MSPRTPRPDFDSPPEGEVALKEEEEEDAEAEAEVAEEADVDKLGAARGEDIEF